MITAKNPFPGLAELERIAMNADTVSKSTHENFPPPANLPPGNSLIQRGLYIFRQIADLQVASVLKDMKPWLEECHGNVLEVGCGAQPYRHLLPSTATYQGLDWEGAKKHFDYEVDDVTYYDGKTFPFPDNHFDYIFHTEVLEHIFDYQNFTNECRRVLKPEGKLFFSIPFQARYHYQPNDYWRFTKSAIIRILSHSKLKATSIKTRGTDITVANYKVISVTYRWLQSKSPSVIAGLLCTPFTVIAILAGHISILLNIGSPDDCLGYNVSAIVANENGVDK